MKHFIYKTTNKTNNKIYIGVHSTNDIDDGYLGSGIALKYAIKNTEKIISKEKLYLTSKPEKKHISKNQKLLMNHL